MNYYFDSNRGNNGNDGLTPDTAKENLEGLRVLLLDNKGVPGTNFLFEAESNFYPERYLRIGVGSEPATYINGTEEDPIKFSSYSYTGTSTRKPHFQLIKTAVATDWKWDGEIKLWYWENNEGYGSTTTTWGSYPLVLIDGEMCLITLAASPTFQRGQTPNGPLEAASWWMTSGVPGRLYVWAPNASNDPATNPTNHYGAGKVKAASSQYSIFQFGRCGSYVTVENLETFDSGPLTNIFADEYATTHITDWTVKNCVARRSAGFSFMQFPDVPEFHGVNISYLNNTIYAQTGPAIQGVADNMLIKGNRFIGANYARNDGGAYYSGVHSPTMYGSIEDNYFYDCRYESALTSGDQWPGGGMGSDGTAVYLEVGAHDIDVKRNIFEECYLACQDNSGGNNVWRSNLIRNCDRFIKVTDQRRANQILGPSVISFYNNTAVGMTLNRIMQKTSRDIIQCAKGLDISSNYTYRFFNNVLIGEGTALTEGWAWAIEPGSNFEAFNNSVFNVYGVKGNVYSHADPVIPPGTITSDPFVKLDGTLDPESPLIKAGLKNNYTNLDCKLFKYADPPTIGAYEYNPFGAATGMI